MLQGLFGDGESSIILNPQAACERQEEMSSERQGGVAIPRLKLLLLEASRGTQPPSQEFLPGIFYWFLQSGTPISADLNQDPPSDPSLGGGARCHTSSTGSHP